MQITHSTERRAAHDSTLVLVFAPMPILLVLRLVSWRACPVGSPFWSESCTGVPGLSLVSYLLSKSWDRLFHCPRKVFTSLHEIGGQRDQLQRDEPVWVDLGKNG